MKAVLIIPSKYRAGIPKTISSFQSANPFLNHPLTADSVLFGNDSRTNRTQEIAQKIIETLPHMHIKAILSRSINTEINDNDITLLRCYFGIDGKPYNLSQAADRISQSVTYTRARLLHIFEILLQVENFPKLGIPVTELAELAGLFSKVNSSSRTAPLIEKLKQAAQTYPTEDKDERISRLEREVIELRKKLRNLEKMLLDLAAGKQITPDD